MSSSSARRWRLFLAFTLWLAPAVVSAQTVTLAWDPSVGATGYTVKWGTALGSYPNSANAGSNTTIDIPGLTPGATYWAVVQAYNSAGVSPYSTPLQFTVTPLPAPCTYSISPTGISAPDTGTSGSITVTTQIGCAWTASSSSGFLALKSSGGTGSGSVAFTVAANTGTSPRTATAIVAGQTFTVSQAAAPACTYSISPSSATASDAGTSGTINVTTQAGCAWSATSASSFLVFLNGTGRTGSGSVGFTVATNTSTSARTGTGTVAGKTFTVSQAAAPACTYSISPTTASVSAAGTSGSITVTTQSGCAWSATSASGLLTFQNGNGRTGSGTVGFTVAANTNTSARTMTGTVAGQTFTVSQAGATVCTYSISPTSASAPDAGTSGSITVTTQSGCAWSATSASGFLTFQNGNGRTGSGTVGFTVAANTNTSARTMTGTVAGQTFTVSQAAAPACTYSISPASTSVSDAAASGTVNVTTQAGCAWSATSASSFLTFSNGTGRSGSGTVNYSMAANTSTSARTGSATIAGQTFTVSQAAPTQACTYSINPVSASAPVAGTSGTITVTTQAGCAWSASSTNSFLTFPDGTGRSGPGTVTFTAAPNTGGFRTGTAIVAGRTFTISQLGTSCTYSISPASVSTSAAAATGTVTVTTQSGCSWSATSMTGFLAFQNGTGRSGPGSVGYTIAENTASGARNAVGAVAGVTFSVAQAGATSTEPPTSGPSPWSSDFDGDGKNDILVHDPVVGTVEAWFLDNATVKGTGALSDSMDANWAPVGRGDFNADGKPDLVWQHKTDGTVSIWYMDGTTRTGVASPSIGAVADTQWKIVGVGDFNADGSADIAWQHAGDGALAVWQMTGTTVNATVNLIPDRTTDVLWKVVGVADFNADGQTDLLWRHFGTGDVGVWLMNGVSRIIYSPLSPFSVPDQRWQVGAVTDANGDGKPDLIWDHTDGTIMIWYMNGTVRTTYPVVPTRLPAGWHVVGPK